MKMVTNEFQKILYYIKQLKKSPFKYPLREYCSHIVETPRCYICNKRKSGIEAGQSPKFDKKWTKGWGVCFHLCHDCNIDRKSVV